MLPALAQRYQQLYLTPGAEGAMLLDGVINWRRIEAHKDAFLADRAAEGEAHPDWTAEFKRFTADKANYADALIVLSAGPYSGVGVYAAFGRLVPELVELFLGIDGGRYAGGRGDFNGRGERGR